MDQPHSLRHHLRVGTRDLHEALDLVIPRLGYLQSAEGFRDFLARSLVFQAAAEDLLDSAGIHVLLPDWPLRRRAHLLRADLAGFPWAPEPRIDSLDVIRLMSGPGSAEHSLGIAYVLEGSVLGAGVVLAEATRRGLEKGRTVSFLAGASLPDRRWKKFTEVLELQDSPALDRSAVLKGARAAFAAAHHCLAGT